MEVRRHVVKHRKPVDVTHRQPLGDGARGMLPESYQASLDVLRPFAAHPQLVHAVRTEQAVCRGEPNLEAPQKLGPAERAQGPGARECGRCRYNHTTPMRSAPFELARGPIMIRSATCMLAV